MSERNLSDAIGIDQGAVEALGRAGVRTVQQLADADPEAVAMASGIPAERIKDWQQRARRMGEKPRAATAAKGWLVGVIGVLIALLLGWALIAIGSAKLRKAEETRIASESKLLIAVGYAADEATADLRDARRAIADRNWGSAQLALAKVATRVKLINDVAPEGEREAVNEVQQLLDDLQTAVGEQSPEASQKLDTLEVALDKMGQEQ